MAKKKGKAKTHSSPASKALPPPASSVASFSIHDVIAAAISSASASSQPALKVCRLCESKDGPFLNIFGEEQTISKKVEGLLPFKILETDELPHKICFRCSAKIEEFHDFVQKCVRSQENLYKAIGKKRPLVNSVSIRQLWEDKLKEMKISNDVVCDSAIKAAIKYITETDPPAPLKGTTSKKTETKIESTKMTNGQVMQNKDEIKEDDSSNRSSRTLSKRKSAPKVETPASKPPGPKSKTILAPPVLEITKLNKPVQPKVYDSIQESNTTKTVDTTTGFNLEEKIEDKPKKPFNIWDHISIIKVNGVGVLFQCHLCDRNFLKRNVVGTHSCAKTGVPKVDNFGSGLATVNKPPPKIPTTVKYINSLTNNEPKKPAETKPAEPKPAEPPAVSETPKPKPRIGPASKVKKINMTFPTVGMKIVPREPTPPPPPPPPAPAPKNISSMPAIEIPAIPGLKNKLRLIPGPNNTFTLVEDPADNKNKRKPSSSENSAQSNVPNKKKCKGKCKQSAPVNELAERLDIVDLDDEPTVPSVQTEPPNKNPQPYPVGLIHATPPVQFTTPAMKKQSYQVVQTGNPSKLLISVKPREQDNSKSKSKHQKGEVKGFAAEKDPFFTLINVDPLLVPSYVLPTNNIIQEAQITTSNASSSSSKKDETYSCNMCPEKFSREKKLLAHVKAHFDKIDQETQWQTVTNPRKKSRKT